LDLVVAKQEKDGKATILLLEAHALEHVSGDLDRLIERLAPLIFDPFADVAGVLVAPSREDCTNRFPETRVPANCPLDALAADPRAAKSAELAILGAICVVAVEARWGEVLQQVNFYDPVHL
jgi:hypothetical protein